MSRFNYILNGLAFDTLVIKCLYGEPTDGEVKECENQIELLKQEKQQLKQALLDIQNILANKQKAKGLTNQLLNIQEQSCLDIVNKTLGSDSNE